MYAFIWVVLLYLIGGINASILLCRCVGKPDPRTQGSKNAGSTNVLRTHGAALAACTLLLDALKGFIPIYALMMSPADMTPLPIWTTALCLGHIFPIYFNFRGGKGVAVTAGMALALNPLGLLLGLCVLATVTGLTRMVSLASILAAATLALCPWWLNVHHPWALTVPCVAVIFAHHGNIKRLMQGSENKIKIKKPSQSC